MTDKGQSTVKKDFTFFINKILGGLSGSSVGIVGPASRVFYGSSSIHGRRKDAAHRRNIAKRQRRRSHLRSLRA